MKAALRNGRFGTLPSARLLGDPVSRRKIKSFGEDVDPAPES